MKISIFPSYAKSSFSVAADNEVRGEFDLLGLSTAILCTALTRASMNTKPVSILLSHLLLQHHLQLQLKVGIFSFLSLPPTPRLSLRPFSSRPLQQPLHYPANPFPPFNPLSSLGLELPFPNTNMIIRRRVLS